MSFHLKTCSIFDVDAEAYVNTINCVGAMGAGVALEFKKRYPEMFEEYKSECLIMGITPGDCWTYLDKKTEKHIFNLAVKKDWRHWATQEWIDNSIKSLKLEILELDIKSVSMPLIGGKNGRRGPYGPVTGYSPPFRREEIKERLKQTMMSFAKKFDREIYLCIPEDKVVEKPEDKIRKIAKTFFNLK